MDRYRMRMALSMTPRPPTQSIGSSLRQPCCLSALRLPMAPLQDHRFFSKPLVPLRFPASHLRNSLPFRISIHKAKSLGEIPPPDAPNPLRNRKIPTFSGNPEEHTLRIQDSSEKASPLSRSPPFLIHFGKTAHRPVSLFDLLSSIDLQVSTQKIASCTRIPSLRHSSALLLAAFSSPFPANAADAEQVLQKFNIEQILVSIDDFFNRNPFFVAGVTVIWLVLIPLTQEYLKKYKFISAIDAFRKLRDMPSAQLLDVRKRQSVKFMDSPNLRILSKNVVRVEYSDGNEEGFIDEVRRNFEDPGNTVICVLDNIPSSNRLLLPLHQSLKVEAVMLLATRYTFFAFSKLLSGWIKRMSFCE
ncbi:hypothetical protein BHE74_00037488 [Ensete ventricosum]|nr:hypothetical protein BHE74_00037488 [Ensete ventricosum]RZS03478.1 hypothetical protein BHM03_00033659 [Ensete ventricosum]